MVPPARPVRCEEQPQPPQQGPDGWSKGKIMEPGQAEVPVEKTADVLKREAKECKRCERWRDDLTKESKSGFLWLNVVDRDCTVSEYALGLSSAASPSSRAA